MGKVSIEQIKELREKTSAGMALCKEALKQTDGDMEKAVEYVNDRSDVVSRLHNETGARIVLCKMAYEEGDKDYKKATEIIHERGWADETSVREDVNRPEEGLIEAYVHGESQKVVSLVEITCKTDFVASQEFVREFSHKVALQVAAMKPDYVSRDRIPEDKIEELEELYAKEAEMEGKPDNIKDKIVKGKLEKYYKEKCLLEQGWIKEDDKTVKNKLDELIGKVGEPIHIRRILWWEFGGTKQLNKKRKLAEDKE